MFDHVFYINLDKRVDRREHMEGQLIRYGMSGERVPGIYTPNQGIVGCGYSHLAVLRLAKQRGYANVLIMEDDFEFIVSPDEFRESVNHCKGMIQTPDFDVCMLAYNMHDSEPTEYAGMGRVLYAQTASAYVVNAHYYDKLISLYEYALPLLESTGMHWVYANDVVWRDLQYRDRWLFFDPRLGKQMVGFSDNAGSFQDHGC